MVWPDGTMAGDIYVTVLYLAFITVHLIDLSVFYFH